jgi:transcriptional regulator with XRE-family HTH domain
MRIRDPDRIGAELRAWLVKNRLTEAALAARIRAENKGLSVTQSWLSRIMAGKFRRLTPTIRAVIGYTDIPITEEARRDRDGKAIIDDAVSSVWNGSRNQAELIARLIGVAAVIGVPPDNPYSRSSVRRPRSGREIAKKRVSGARR